MTLTFFESIFYTLLEISNRQFITLLPILSYYISNSNDSLILAARHMFFKSIHIAHQ